MKLSRFETAAMIFLASLCLFSGFVLLALDSRPVVAQSSRTLADQIQGTTAVTCAANVVDGGVFPAACTLALDKGVVAYTCADADGCNVTLSEVGGANYSGRTMRVVNVGTNTVNFADTSGASELAGSFAAGQWDALTLIYLTDRWVELGRSNN